MDGKQNWRDVGRRGDTGGAAQDTVEKSSEGSAKCNIVNLFASDVNTAKPLNYL